MAEILESPELRLPKASKNKSPRRPRRSSKKASNTVGSTKAKVKNTVTKSPPKPDWQRKLTRRINASWRDVKSVLDGNEYKLSKNALYVQADALGLCGLLPDNSVHAVVTDPPYGLIEYNEKNLSKRRNGKGGVWRIPPSFDGVKRAPLPRFTVLSETELEKLADFFKDFAQSLERILVPGGHVIIASNPLLSTLTFNSFIGAGLEKRGEFIRRVQTLRGGYRPKGAESNFPDVSVMPRSCFEPWGIFRKPFTGTVANNLREWGAGGLRRPENGDPVKDVIMCSPTGAKEKKIAPHPSLKPQRFMRQIVRASLPLGQGLVLDPFAGSGSTLAAAQAVSYRSLGIERENEYVEMARGAFSSLSQLKT